MSLSVPPPKVWIQSVNKSPSPPSSGLVNLWSLAAPIRLIQFTTIYPIFHIRHPSITPTSTHSLPHCHRRRQPRPTTFATLPSAIAFLAVVYLPLFFFGIRLHLLLLPCTISTPMFPIFASEDIAITANPSTAARPNPRSPHQHNYGPPMHSRPRVQFV